MTTRQLRAIAKRHGTPVVVIDHDVIRAQLRQLQAAACRRCRRTTR